MYHMHTLGASKCMHVVHSVGFAFGVGFGWFYLIKRLSKVEIMGAWVVYFFKEIIGYHLNKSSINQTKITTIGPTKSQCT